MIGLTTLFILLGSAIATYILVPKIVGIARHKRLLDSPNSRSSHKESTPNLGGVAFFVTLMLAVYFINRLDSTNFSDCLIPCLTILFIVGLKDDLVVISARTKFLAQLVVSAFLMAEANLGITNLHGFIGLYEISPIVGNLLIILIIIGVINAMNLIDGVDGLASMVGIVSLSAFAVLFFMADRNAMGLLALSMIGCLLGFIPYNIGVKNKIFMGDTGSMIVGFILAYFSIVALALPSDAYSNLLIEPSNVPAMLMFFMFIPIMDTLRIMTVRIMKGKSPFQPDRTHLHHYFIFHKKLTHLKTTVSITLIALSFVILGYFACVFFYYWVNILIFYGLSVFASFDITSKAKNMKRKRNFWAMLNGSIRSLL